VAGVAAGRLTPAQHMSDPADNVSKPALTVRLRFSS
jgi:hypothetical protein